MQLVVSIYNLNESLDGLGIDEKFIFREQKLVYLPLITFFKKLGYPLITNFLGGGRQGCEYPQCFEKIIKGTPIFAPEK